MLSLLHGKKRWNVPAAILMSTIRKSAAIFNISVSLPSVWKKRRCLRAETARYTEKISQRKGRGFLDGTDEQQSSQIHYEADGGGEV